MDVYKGYNYRIYPTKTQVELIEKTFEACKFVYNTFLVRQITANVEGTFLSYKQCSKDLTKLKSEQVWLNDVDSSALQTSLRNLDKAFKYHELRITNHPKMKKQFTYENSYNTKNTNNNIKYLGRYIQLPKLGKIKTRNRLVPKGTIINATIRKKATGKYFVSLGIKEQTKNIPVPTSLNDNTQMVGIDLGISSLMTTNAGEKEANQHFLEKDLNKIQMLQKKLSNQVEGSKNYDKTRKKLALVHERITNRRRDYIAKQTTALVKANTLVATEDLQVKKMMKKNYMARAIGDAAWGKVLKQINYKTFWEGKKHIKVDKYFESSQICSVCGLKNVEIKDCTIREWCCSNCNTVHDRDVNAGINILNKALLIM